MADVQGHNPAMLRGINFRIGGGPRHQARPGLLAPGLTLVLGGLLTAGLAPDALADSIQGEVRQLDHADFSLKPEGPWTPVSLPDTWGRRDVRPRQPGHYRATLRLDAAPSRVWALQADRMSTSHEVRLNGHVVHSTLDDATLLRRPMPTLITLPPDLWVAGENLLEITLNGGARAGLSPLNVGPEDRLARGFLWSHHIGVSLPQLLNAGSAGIAVFMLILWSRRREDAALGTFSALCLLAALRNQGYFLVGHVVSGAFTDWIFFVAQVATVVLLGRFAMHFSGRRWPTFELALLATAIAYPVIGIAAGLWDALHNARAWLYPWLNVLTLPALWLIVQRAHERRSAIDFVLVGALAVVIGCGAHDYLYQQGYTSIMDAYWMPYAVPLVLAVFSTALLQRLVAALADVERMNTSLEGRVAQRTRELHDAIALKDRFLAVASHDLRQPLLSIGLLGSVLRDRVTDPMLRGLVDRMDASIQGLEQMLKRLLDLSRLESGAVQLAPLDLPLRDLLHRVANDCHAEAEAKGLSLRLRCPPVAVHADPALLEQIVRNLVGNAVRHTLDGGVLIAARHRPGSPSVRIEVWDTGPGIRRADHERVFEEFQQTIETASPDTPAPAASAHDPYRGVGLGLAIVRRAAEVMQLPVTLHSRPGHGTLMRIEVPLAARPRQTPASLPPASAPPAGNAPIDGPLEGRRIWVLEDDRDARQASLTALMALGADVRVFASIAEVQHHLTVPPGPSSGPAPHALLSDQHLPDGHVTGLLTRWSRRWPGAPVLVMTGHLGADDRERLARQPVTVLPKPFGRDELVRALRDAWEQGA